MKTRDEAARELAERMGWEWRGESSDAEWVPLLAGFAGVGPYCRRRGTVFLTIPAPDAPLHEKLAFVGWIAEALGKHVGLCRDDCRDGAQSDLVWTVAFFKQEREREWAYAHDLVHAALLAALAAKEER